MDLGQNSKIDTKLLALINNDVFITGTRNLAGAEYDQTIFYLQHFVSHRDNIRLVDSIFSSPTEKKEYEAFTNRLNSLSLASKEINDIHANLARIPKTEYEYGYQTAYKNEKTIEDAINSGCKKFVERVIRLNKSTDSFPSSVLMPGGWTGKPGKSGHAIVYEFKKDKNGDYIFLVYNSGAGLEFHENVTSADKDRYKTVKAYKIPATEPKEELRDKLNYFVSELIKPEVLPVLDGKKRRNDEEDEYDANTLYQQVFRKISYLNGAEIPLEEAELNKATQELASVGQRAGTCAEKSLQELMKLSIKSKEKGKVLIFLLKLFSIEEFIAQHEGTMDIKKTSQLKWASQNLSKLMIQQKDSLPEALQIRATKVLEKTQVILEQEKNKKKLTQSQTTDAIAKLSENRVLPENIRSQGEIPTVSVEPSDKIIIEKKFNEKTENIVHALTSSPTLNMQALRDFKYKIQNLESNDLYKDAEQALFDYFTQVSLDKSYFSTITNAADALEYVELISILASKYMRHKALPHPKKTAVLLNVTELLDTLYQLDVVKMVNVSGIDSFYPLGKGFAAFKETQSHNAYLSTDIPTVDKRTKEIIERRRNYSALELDDFMDNINKGGNKTFKTFLVRLFDQNIPSSSLTTSDHELKNYLAQEMGISPLYWGDSGFSKYEYKYGADAINHRKALAAYFLYFGKEMLKEEYIRNPSKYKIEFDELNKLNFFKKMKVFSREIESGHISGHLNISNESIFTCDRTKDYYGEIKSNHQFSIKNKLRFGAQPPFTIGGTEQLRNYFNPITDVYDVNPLEQDKKARKNEHEKIYSDNQIFFNPEGVQVEGTQLQTENGRLHQKLMHLRTAPDLQVMTTIDYFRDKWHLFSNKVIEENKNGKVEKDNPLKKDMQEYLKRNLFQPGLLLNELHHNPDSFDVIQEEFIAKGIKFFTKNNKVTDETLFFYELQQDINEYALKSPSISSNKKRSIFTDMASTYKNLNEINQGELNQSERYELSKTKLKLQVRLLDYVENEILLSSEKEKHYKILFQAYMNFSESSRDIILDSTEKTEELNQLKHLSIEMLKKDPFKNKVFDWAIEYTKEKFLIGDNQKKQKLREDIETASSSQKVGQFPYFYIKDILGKDLLAIDMLEGQVLIEGGYDCYPSDKLVNSPIYKLILGTERPRMSVSIMENRGVSFLNRNSNVKVYKPLNDSDAEGKFIEMQLGAEVPFVYQQNINFRSEQRTFERKLLLPANQISKVSLTIQDKKDIAPNMSLNLPESFYSSETACWVACDKKNQGAIYIEKMNGQYAIDMEPDGRYGVIKELDSQKKDTGYVLSTDYDDAKVKAVLNVFKGFDDPQFTEILFKPSNNVDKKVEKLKVKFPRYNLELEGEFNVTSQKWEIYQTNNPELVLVHDKNIQINPNIDISNNLVFEHKRTKQQYLYVPVQDFYINPNEKRDENASETVYYKPKLDTLNAAKRIRQGKTLFENRTKPKLSLNRNLSTYHQPDGATTYSQSEEFRVFPIDMNTKEIKTATSEDKLHLAYLNLVNLQPEEALNSIRSILKTGGLKGTLKELELIEKIFNRAPLDASSIEINLSIRINSPEFVAVRAHILYLISDLYEKKHIFPIPDINKIEVNTPDDFMLKKQFEILKSFETAIPSLMHEHLNESLNKHSATPKEMRLPKSLEYKMIPRLENGYHLKLLDISDLGLIDFIKDILQAPVLIRKSAAMANEKNECFILGKDRYGKNQLSSIKHIDLMNTFQFGHTNKLVDLNSVYVSEEKNRELFLEINNTRSHVYQTKTVPVQARYEHLKNWYRTRELAKIDENELKNSARKIHLEKKVKRKKVTESYEKKVESKIIKMPLIKIEKIGKETPEKGPDRTIFKAKNNADIYLDFSDDRAKELIARGERSTLNIQDLHPNMTNEQFLEHIIPILHLAKSNKGANRDKLQSFLENTLKANCKILPEDQKSLIRNWAPSILTVIDNARAFNDIDLEVERTKPFNDRDWDYKQQKYVDVVKTIIRNPDRHHDFVKEFLSRAYIYNANKFYPVQIRDYQYHLKSDVNISSKQFKIEKYVPLPMKILSSKEYNNVAYYYFLTKTELDPFYDEIEKIKQERLIKVEMFKTSLDMKIRENSFAQKIEFLEKKIKKEKSDSLESELKLVRTEYQKAQKKIDILKNEIEANFKKPPSQEVLSEREMLCNSFRALTKERGYQDTAEIKRQYDEKIGDLKNEEDKAIYAATCNILNDKVRGKVNDTCTQFISIIDPKIKKLEKKLLLLANKGPKDSAAQAQYRRALQARKREPITLSDLNRLFVTSDKNEYKKITGLDDDDIENLYQDMAVYINLGILKQQYTRMQSAVIKTDSTFFSSKDKINEVIELGRMLATNNMISPTESADIQFFQKEENILITPLQKFYLDILLKRDDITGEYKNEVIQLIMGGGKSKVLGPLSMLKKANGTNLAIFQVKNSLLKTNFADMYGTSMRLFNQEAVLFEFDRNSPCSTKDLKEIYNKFHKTAMNKGYIVTSGTSLQSLELKYLETLAEKPEDTSPNNAEFIEWHKKIKWFERSLDLIQTKGDRVIDEVHDELDSNKELNYTIGDSKPPSKEDISFIIDIFYFLNGVSLSKNMLGIDKDIRAIDLIYNNKFITDPEKQMVYIKAKIADDLINKLNTTNTNPIAKIINKLNLKSDSEKQALKEYLLNQNGEILPELESKLSKSELKSIAFVKSQVSKFLPVTLLKNYNENYGPSRIEGILEVKRKVAIPYTDLNTPNERSRFGEFTEAMNYTVQMNLIEPLSSELVREIITDYIDKARKEQADYANTTFESTSANIEYNVKFGKVNKPTLEQIENYVFDKTTKTIDDDKLKIISSLFFNDNPPYDQIKRKIKEAHKEVGVPFSESKSAEKFDLEHAFKAETQKIELEFISRLNENELDSLVNILKNSESFKKTVLADRILTQVENNPLVLTSNTQDSGDMTNTTQAMSGTPHNFKAYHRNIHFDEYQGLGTDGETISLLKNKNTPVVDSAKYESVIDLLEEFHANNSISEAQRMNTRAIIDAGALFKKEKSNFDVAKKIGQHTQDNPKNYSAKIKYVLYFENKGDVLHAWDIEKQKKIRLATSDEKEISKILNCKPEERFTFYDQARITGTDIKQASGENLVKNPNTGKEEAFSANAILTFSEKTSKFSFLQAAKRMRQLHNNQTISVIKADYLKKRLPKDNDIDEVLSFVNKIQVDKALSVHFKATGHKFKNALRRSFMDKIRRQEKDPVKKSKLLEMFSPVFYKSFKPEHFLNHGVVETEQDAILYFPVVAKNYYKQWKNLCIDAGIAVMPDEKTNMKKILDSLAADAIDICEKVFKSKPVERAGAESAQEDNMGNEVENELQNELEIQLQKELELEKEIISYDKNKSKYIGNHYRLADGTNLITENPSAQLHAIKKVIPNIPLDDNIFMTSLQRQTVNGTFVNYYEQHIKPFDVVMMVAEKNRPETLQCIILTKEEAQAHIHNRIKYHTYKDVWFVSCHDTVLYGKKPQWLKSEDIEPEVNNIFRYNRILEQIRYINGDLNAIMKQKEGLTWLNESAQEKLTYLTDTVLKRFPESIKYYGNLKSRLDVTAKIFNHMQNNPFEDYTDPEYDWNDVSKNYNDITEEGKERIRLFANALREINVIYDNNYEDNKLSKIEIEKKYTSEVAYRLNQYKKTFLEKRTEIIKALSNNKPLDALLSNPQYKNVDLNFLVNKKTLFQIVLNNKTVSSKNLETLMTKGNIKWNQKNGEIPPKTNAELIVLHAVEKNKKEGKSINDTLLEVAGGESKDVDKVSKLIYDKNNKNESLLIHAVKYNNIELLTCIEEDYLSIFQEKELIDLLKLAQKQLKPESSSEIRKLIQIQGKDGDLIEKHKRLRTVIFDRINTCIESQYETLSKLNFAQRPFSLVLDFNSYTSEDIDFIKSVVNKLIDNPNKAIFEYFNKKELLKQPDMLDKKTVLIDVIQHSENILDKDLNDIITILISNQAEVKSAFACALESQKSRIVLGHLKAQKGIDIYFDPDKAGNKQFLLLRNYKKDSTEELIRKISVCQDLNADLSGVLDNKGNAIIHHLCFLENDAQKLEKIIPALLSAKTFDLNAKNSAGSTALHAAIIQGNTSMVKVLLAQKDNKKQDKIDIDIKNGNNKTAMDLVSDALTKDETYKPEIVTLVTEAYQRKHKDYYLKEIPAEKILADKIWDYINNDLPKKPDLKNDKKLVNRMIHAYSRNEYEFNINKSEFYQYLNTGGVNDKIAEYYYLDHVELYDNIQFDKNLMGKEQTIEGFYPPKLAEIQKENLDNFPERWPRNEVIALQVFSEILQLVHPEYEDEFLLNPQMIAKNIRNILNNNAKTPEEFYAAKKTFISNMEELSKIPSDEIMFPGTWINPMLKAVKTQPHKFFPVYREPKQVKSQEYTGGSIEPKKDWSKIAHGYLADIIPSGQYLNRYQDIPFNDFISGNASTKEEFDKLKSEIKKYLNMIFQDTIKEKEFVISALDKVSFKSKIEEKISLTPQEYEQIDQDKYKELATTVFNLFPEGIAAKHKKSILEKFHSVCDNQEDFKKIVIEFCKIVESNLSQPKYKLAGFAAKTNAFTYNPSLHPKLQTKSETIDERIGAEKQLTEATKNEEILPTKLDKSLGKTTKFYDKNYSAIVREIYNFAIPFTNNYEKSFDPAYKIKLKEHAETQEDFDEINNELKVLFKKQLTPGQAQIASDMLNSIKTSDLNLKISTPKIESKVGSNSVQKSESNAQVTISQVSQKPKPSTVVTPTVQSQPIPPVVTTEQLKSSVSVPVSTPSTSVIQPTSPVVIPKPLTTGAILVSQLEDYLPNKFDNMQQLDKEIQAELKRLSLLTDTSSEEIKDLNNARGVIKSFMKYKELIDKEPELNQMSQIPQELIKDLFSKAENATQQFDKADFDFAYGYLNRAKNILTTKIDPSLFKLNALLRSDKPIKDDDIKLYSMYLNDLELLHGGYEQLEDVEKRHKLFGKTKVTYDEQGNKKTKELLSLISHHHTRVTEIEQITSDACNLIANISVTERAKLFPNRLNTLTHFEELMTLLKDKSAIAATNARKREEVYASSPKQSTTIVQPSSPVVPTQQGINLIKQQKTLELLKDLEPLTQEMSVFQEKFEGAQNVHDFTVYFGEKYRHLLAPLDKKYHVSSTMGVTLDTVCEEILKMPLMHTSANQIDINKVISDIKSNGDKNVPEINLNLSELLIKSWSLAKQLPANKNEKETILLLLQDNKLADGGCLPGIGARLISGYSACVRDILDTELYNTLQTVDFDDIDADQKRRLLTNSALAYIAQKTNNLKATPLKQGRKNPDFKVDVGFLNSLLHLHSTSEEEFYKNKLVLLKTIYQKMSPFNPQKRHEFDTVKMMFDLVGMHKTQLGKGSMPSDFSLIKIPEPLPPVQVPQKPPTTSALNFDLKLHCKASAWHNNCALNCLTHFIYSKLESNDIQSHFNNDPAYILLRESFKEYYNLATTPTWEQIKGILDDYPVAHDREAVFAPVLRVYLSKIIVKEKEQIWNTEASAALSEYLRTGVATDVAKTIVKTNETRMKELKKQFDAELSKAMNPQTFTRQETAQAVQSIESWNKSAKTWNASLDAWNKNPDNIKNQRKPKAIINSSNTIQINERIIFQRSNAIEDKYNDIAHKDWEAENDLCEIYAKHMANMANGELVSVNQLGLIAAQLGLGLEVFTLTHKYELGADVRPQASQDWILKAYNPSEIHWEYEEPTHSETKTIQHNKDYTETNNSIFKTYGSAKPITDEEIKKIIVKKYTEKGFNIPSVPAQNTGGMPSIPPTMPKPVQVQPTLPTSSPFDANVIADEIYQEAKLQTQDFTVAHLKMFSEKINNKVNNETEFNAVIKALKEDVLNLYLDQEPKKLNLAIRMLGKPKYVPKVSSQLTQPNVPVTTPNIPTQTQPQSIVTQPAVVVSQQSSGIPPIQSVPVSNPVPVQPPPPVTASQQTLISNPQPVISQGTDSSVQQSPKVMPQGTVSQQVATGTNQATPSTPPVVTQPQQSGGVKPTQFVSVSNPTQTQQQSPAAVVTQPALTVPQQGVTPNQATAIPLIQISQPAQAFTPFQSGSGLQSASSMSQKPAKEKAQEIFDGFPYGIAAKHKKEIITKLHAVCANESEFKEIVSEFVRIVVKGIEIDPQKQKLATFATKENAFGYNATLHSIKPVTQSGAAPVQQPSTVVLQQSANQTAQIVPSKPLSQPVIMSNPSIQQPPIVVAQPPVVSPQQNATANQATQSTPSIHAPQQPVIAPTKLTVLSTQSAPVQQPPTGSVTQAPVTVPQQSTTGNQTTIPKQLPVPQQTIPVQVSLPVQTFTPLQSGSVIQQQASSGKSAKEKAQEIFDNFPYGIAAKHKKDILTRLHVVCTNESEFKEIVSEFVRIVVKGIEIDPQKQKLAGFATKENAFGYNATLHPAKPTGPGNGP